MVANTDDLDDDETPPEDSTAVTLGAVKFEGLSPTDFEEFCFDLLSETGFTNVDWRKGTPRDSSPADRGRDIVAYLEREDVDGHRHLETWFVDCKHYDRAVPPEALQGAITWAQAERPSTVLFIASGYLSNGAKDWIASYAQQSHPPFRIRVWEMPQIRRMLVGRIDLAFKHDISTTTLRRVSEILTIESELTDKFWYGRKPGHDQPVREGLNPDLVERMRAAQRTMEEQYGVEELESHTSSDFVWGMLSGKLSAIRWVLGDDWDVLDT